MEDSEKPAASSTNPGNDPERSSSAEYSASAPKQEHIPHRYQNTPQPFAWLIEVVEWLDSHDGLITAAATLAIAALTYYLAAYAAGQEKILKQQIADSHAIQRAFVTSSGYAVEFHEEFSQKWYRFLVGWENRGNTPTRNAKIVLTCPKSRTHVADPLVIAKIENSMLARRSIGPKETTPGGVCEFDVPFISNVKSGKLIIYLMAAAVYDDVFRSHHVTMYCREIAGVAGPIGVPMNHGTSFFDMPCKNYNCTDEECGDVSDKLAR